MEWEEWADRPLQWGGLPALEQSALGLEQPVQSVQAHWPPPQQRQRQRQRQRGEWNAAAFEAVEWEQPVTEWKPVWPQQQVKGQAHESEQQEMVQTPPPPQRSEPEPEPEPEPVQPELKLEGEWEWEWEWKPLGQAVV